MKTLERIVIGLASVGALIGGISGTFLVLSELGGYAPFGYGGPVWVEWLVGAWVLLWWAMIGAAGVAVFDREA